MASTLVISHQMYNPQGILDPNNITRNNNTSKCFRVKKSKWRWYNADG